LGIERGTELFIARVFDFQQVRDGVLGESGEEACDRCVGPFADPAGAKRIANSEFGKARAQPNRVECGDRKRPDAALIAAATAGKPGTTALLRFRESRIDDLDQPLIALQDKRLKHRVG
jgi:hypothetical protein